MSLTGASSVNCGILEYRQKQKILHGWAEKYSKMMEFDPIKRHAGRIVNFVRKRMLYDPCNISEECIKQIPGFFRFRCYVYDMDEELSVLNEIYLTQMDVINSEQNEEIKKVLTESLISEIDKQKENLRNSKNSVKYPIMLDLRDYIDTEKESTSDVSVFFDNKLFMLDENTAKRLHRECEKTNTKHLKYEQYMQMLNYSKALSATYCLDGQINKK
jgi:hypothetical protein